MHERVPAGWRAVTYRDVLIENDERAGDRLDLPVLSVTKSRGPMLASERFGKALHSRDLSRYRVAHRGVIVADPMLLWDGSIGIQRVVGAGLVSPDYRVYAPSSDADPAFMAYVVRSPIMLSHYQDGARGTNVRRNRIARADFQAIPLALPPLPEQRKIAAILSAVDDAIEGTQAAIDQLQVVKKAMMAELLTRGVPGQHTRFRQTEIGEVPEGWDVLSLECLCSHIVDCPHETPDCIDVGYPVIRTADVVPGKILLAQARRVSAETYTRRTRRLQPEAGDVLYSREGERYGIAAPVPQGVQLCLGQRMMQFRASQETDSSFLCWLLNSPQVYQQARDEVGGSTSPHVNIKSIRKFVVARPPLSEQRQIGIALDMLCEREAAEDSVVGVLRTLKTALMSVLLTGELRVTPDEATP